MFHRVKSERQPHEEEDQNTVEEAATEEETSYDASADDEAESAEDESQAEDTAEQEEAEESSSNLDIPSTPPYQRGLQTAGRPAAPLTGNTTTYGSSSIPAAAPSVASETTSEGGSRLTIGRGITMSGEIEACDYLLVEGTVEAALKGAKALDIAESGTFYGTVEIDDATVAGRFEGDLTVSGRLTVKASGVITGTISYSELAVEAGAVIEGALTPMTAESLSRSSTPSKAKSEGGSKAKKGKRPQPANSDNSLFRATAAAE